MEHVSPYRRSRARLTPRTAAANAGPRRQCDAARIESVHVHRDSCGARHRSRIQLQGEEARTRRDAEFNDRNSWDAERTRLTRSVIDSIRVSRSLDRTELDPLGKRAEPKGAGSPPNHGREDRVVKKSYLRSLAHEQSP